MTATAQRRQPISLEQISLRRRERGFIVGGTDAGKSTLLELLALDFLHRYRRQGARRLILDTKPRYRAQWTVQGAPASRRYKGWAHGAFVAGSIVVDDPRDMDLAWRLGANTVIMQCDTAGDRARLIAGAAKFLRDSKASRDQLLQVDESLDFFHSNGAPRGGDDALERAARAGRERGTACAFGSQRTKGLSQAFLSEMTRLYCLRMDSRGDAKRFSDFGAPMTPEQVPTRPHEFMYWWKGDKSHPGAYRTLYGPYSLDLAK